MQRAFCLGKFVGALIETGEPQFRDFVVGRGVDRLFVRRFGEIRLAGREIEVSEGQHNVDGFGVGD